MQRLLTFKVMCEKNRGLRDISDIIVPFNDKGYLRKVSVNIDIAEIKAIIKERKKNENKA